MLLAHSGQFLKGTVRKAIGERTRADGAQIVITVPWGHSVKLCQNTVIYSVNHPPPCFVVNILYLEEIH